MANGAVPAAELITEFEVPSAEGNERLAIERVVAAIDGLGIAESRLERLKTAVGEASHADERVTGTDPAVAATVGELQSLGEELDLADAAAAELHVGAACRVKLEIDLLF